MSKNILLVAGTRPNFVKLAPLYHALKEYPDELKAHICHTGQHFDFSMSDVFWENLELPTPEFQLNVRGAGVADTIGKTILAINEVVSNNRFDLVIVFGDVNATVAGSIVAAQSRIPVMHVEAGLRSFDRDMPEEINRIISDHVCDYLMVSEPSGIENLKKEGIADSKVHFVGNIMIESLLRTEEKWRRIELSQELQAFAMDSPVVFTFHRPENVDSLDRLKRLIEVIAVITENDKGIFPIHPRTHGNLSEHNLLDELNQNKNLLVTEPLGYFHFLNLISKSKMAVTDSGGIQEEASFLNIPCVTFRKNTERPVTISEGTNLLLGLDDENISGKTAEHIVDVKSKSLSSIPLWDKDVSKRIIDVIRGNIFSA